ncbi:MAG: shikimate dehydrogenase family protein [Candidatus Limimorpha sp.]
MKLFGLVGHPLVHSFSKTYFENKFKEENLDCSFVNFDIDDINKIEQVLSKHDNIKGFTVTHPYKYKIIRFLSYTDPVAKEIGAVNVVKIGDDGRLYGFNSDIIGFQSLLSQSIKGRNISKAILCGTGGAAKSVKYVLNRNNIPTDILSRSDDSYKRILSDGFHNNELVINATPVGMYPNIKDALDLPYQTANATNVFIDLIYNPEETSFMKKARKYGAAAFNGLKMLHEQAEEAWKIWCDPL